MWSCFFIEKATPYIKNLSTTWNEVRKSQTAKDMCRIFTNHRS